MTTMDDVVRFWSSSTPKDVAIRYNGDEITWHELESRAAVAAAELRDLGCGVGDHVAILLENRPEFLVYLVAVHRLGGTVVPINVLLAPREVPGILDRADVKTIVSSDAFTDHASEIESALPHVIKLNVDHLSDERPAGIYEYATTAGDDLAFILFTSGTTGAAKGAMLTYDSYLAGCLKIMLSDRMNHDDRHLIALPLPFTGSICVLVGPVLLAGATIVLEPKFDSARTLAQLEAERATIFYGVPYLFQEMARRPEFPSADLTALRVARAAGAPVPLSLLETWAEKGVSVGQGYALTEGGGTNIHLPLELSRQKVGYAGMPLLGGRARVVDENGNDCAPGEPGELLLQGPEIMKGYYKNPEATAKVLVDGWLHTGDVVEMDADGFIRVVDRQSDMIISGGLNVYPSEVEEAILNFPDVVSTAVFGTPDEKWGEVVTAVVVARPDAEIDVEALQSHVRTSIGAYKIPRKVIVQHHDMPRNMTNKVLKHELKGMHS